uniref:Uncharacterized protein n=1 Tax=Siphoviridae sp. ctnPP24 TaxID=2825662 RepID=A0A8S5TZ18_9CAUD|nr:MAG TPA: hypothetical protein [Siphoviridae sp. ctnPP24]
MAESYGLNFNLAMTTNEDGVVDLGVHVTDSDGLDLDHKASGKDGLKVVNDITSTLARELRAVSNGRKQKKDKEGAEKLEKERAERATKLANLKSQAEEIKKQIADLEKDAKAAESVRTSRPSYESLLDQDFARLLKIFG